jgi:hypothetical protein
LIHAAGESSPGSLPKNTHAVALHADSEAVLSALEKKLKDSGVSFISIREPDRNNELMAIGIVPIARDKIRKLLSKFALIK